MVFEEPFCLSFEQVPSYFGTNYQSAGTNKAVYSQLPSLRFSASYDSASYLQTMKTVLSKNGRIVGVVFAGSLLHKATVMKYLRWLQLSKGHDPVLLKYMALRLFSLFVM